MATRPIHVHARQEVGRAFARREPPVLVRLECPVGVGVLELELDHTTTSVAGTAARAARLAAAGVAFVHAPVFMSPAAARESKGIMLASAPQAVYARVAESLAAMTGKVLYLGERPDLAAAKKLFGNAMIVPLVGGLADVFAMAQSSGIDPKDALSLFDHFNPHVVFSYRGKAMAAGDYRASFELSMARKDVRLMLEAAGDAKLAVLPAIAERIDELLAAGHGRDDLGILSVESIPASRV